MIKSLSNAFLFFGRFQAISLEISRRKVGPKLRHDILTNYRSTPCLSEPWDLPIKLRLSFNLRIVRFVRSCPSWPQSACRHLLLLQMHHLLLLFAIQLATKSHLRWQLFLTAELRYRRLQIAELRQ